MGEVHLRPRFLSVLLFSRALEMGPSAYNGLWWAHADRQHDKPGRASEFKTSQSLEARGKCVPRCVCSVTLFDLESVAFFLSLSPVPGLK